MAGVTGHWCQESSTPSSQRAHVRSGYSQVFTRVLYTIGYTTGDVAKARYTSRDTSTRALHGHLCTHGQRNSYGGVLGELPLCGVCFSSELS